MAWGAGECACEGREPGDGETGTGEGCGGIFKGGDGGEVGG